MTLEEKFEAVRNGTAPPEVIAKVTGKPYKGNAMKISYTKDRKNEGVYNIRVIGPNAAGLTGQTVSVSTASGVAKQETLGKCFWSGTDNDGEDVALYAKANAQGAPQGGNVDLERRLQAVEAQLKSLLAIMKKGSKPSFGSVDTESLPF